MLVLHVYSYLVSGLFGIIYFSLPDMYTCGSSPTRIYSWPSASVVAASRIQLTTDQKHSGKKKNPIKFQKAKPEFARC